jgi:dCMP deaminase
MNRPPVADTLFQTAQAWSKRSTCPAAKVGAVLARNGVIVAVGYNGAPHGASHCSDVGCVIQDATETQREMSRHIHAEVNALLHCARNGVSCKDCTMYVTKFPCFDCIKFMAQAGVKYVRFPNDTPYISEYGNYYDFACECGIELDIAD